MPQILLSENSGPLRLQRVLILATPENWLGQDSCSSPIVIMLLQKSDRNPCKSFKITTVGVIEVGFLLSRPTMTPINWYEPY